ncbi:hypothetical protein J3R83DRAFT_10983 [Lanmaoa asiatica]|nr:hypothetical protein J3R83DRAFT_10983 [Lanmaoa asiatica]
MKLYDRLHELLMLSLAGQRMKLLCLTFKLGPVSVIARRTSGRVFRAKTDALGTVETMTTEDLSRMDSLTLVHPWIDFLLDRRPIGSIAELIPEENTNDQSSSRGDFPSPPGHSNTASTVREGHLIARLVWPFGTWAREAASLLAPSPVLQTGNSTQALQLIARLRQPFSALLFTPTR